MYRVALMNSLAVRLAGAPVRRESNLSFFILEGPSRPEASTTSAYDAIAAAAARLSCPDERFADFAAATGVEVGPLTPDERDALRAEIDALVARACGTRRRRPRGRSSRTSRSTPYQSAYRELVRDRFAALYDDVAARRARQHSRGSGRTATHSRTSSSEHRRRGMRLSIATGYVNLGGLHHLAIARR